MALSFDGTGYPETPSVAEFRIRVSDCLVGRCLITTTDGYIGVAPKTVRLGDQIAVLAGGYSPVIVRKSFKAIGGHHLIGSCFLQGFMWLEAFLGPLPEHHHYVARQGPGEDYAIF
ncbi:hypothetical protein BDV96DRAFT_641207 [Lophiotrema nucula]|uniref:Uncharacterized protein n=1 Tax=Lophiotrema nucula TaxID=690887 RepID=A0A6A5ZQH7_9PLEO|nr:hypothetical protein BDV96DRAFT_641207 [Lophiotrema nucula]